MQYPQLIRQWTDAGLCRIAAMSAAFLFVTASAERNPSLNLMAIGRTAPVFNVVKADRGEYAGDTYIIRGGGQGFHWAWDRGALAYLTTAKPNFSFTVRIKTAPQVFEVSNFGIDIREGLVGNERNVSLRYDDYVNYRCLNYMYRFIPGEWKQWNDKYASNGSSDINTYASYGPFPDFPDRQNVFIRIVRANHRYRLFARKGTVSTWTELATKIPVMLNTDTVHVGVFVAFGNDGKNVGEMVVDNVEFAETPTEAQATRTVTLFGPQANVWTAIGSFDENGRRSQGSSVRAYNLTGQGTLAHQSNASSPAWQYTLFRVGHRPRYWR